MDWRELGGRASGHGWTIGSWFFYTVIRPGVAPASEPWSVVAEDPKVGSVRLTGRIRHQSSRKLVVVVHGLGGDVEAPYVVAASLAAEAAGLSCLRINLRGADRSGEDYYHAGLTADLHAALSSEELLCYEEVFVLGYSVGGHLTLRYSTDAPDPRVRAVAAVSPPLDLDLCATAFDRPGCEIYRRSVLGGLKEIYEKVAERRSVPAPVEEVRRLRKIREWDNLVVAPRYGFRDAEHYYRSVSVAPRLAELPLRSLVLFAKNDPMVPASAVAENASRCGPNARVEWIDTGGHMAFSSKLDLGCGGALGLEAQIMSWLQAGSNDTHAVPEVPWPRS